MNDMAIYTRFNVLGIDLLEDQIRDILDLSIESTEVQFRREWLASFFSIDESELSRTNLTRYAEVDLAMTNISAGSNNDDIHTRVIQPLASAKKCYAYSEYLASIELTALHAEMLVNYLCTADKDALESKRNSLSAQDQQHINDNISEGAFFADKINQVVRLRWLLSANLINIDDKKAFERVHGLRINYFHRWQPSVNNAKNDALDIMSTISPISAKYLELHDKANNIERIRRYMKSIL